MAYVLNQYNYNTASSSAMFMDYIKDGVVSRKDASSSSTPGEISDLDIFKDECIMIPDKLLPVNNYYFHGKIKKWVSLPSASTGERTTSEQVFNIKLIQKEDTSTEQVEQYIKTITIPAGDGDEWVDVEFIFNPYTTFDYIMFELKRTVDDYKTEKRYPKIIYEELSVVNNVIGNVAGEQNIDFIKMGIQSRPGLMMAINGEEIRIGRSGIYEIKNGTILVSNFSVVAGGAENGSALIDAIASINTAYEAATTVQALSDIQSVCLFNTDSYPKTRTIDSFTLDFLYRKE